MSLPYNKIQNKLTETEALTEDEIAAACDLPMDAVWDALETLVENGEAWVCRTSEERNGEGATYLRVPASERPLTFPFGETPEDVIREQAAKRSANGRVWVTFADDRQMSFRDGDDLLTVLGSLKARAKELMRGNALDPVQTDEGQLRIDILSALGIDEGGE